MDLIREILIYVESYGKGHLEDMGEVAVSGFSSEQITHHIWLLWRAGYIEAIDASSFDGSHYIPSCLTWSGHEFLDTIRDQEIWRKTKEAAKEGGAQTLEFVWGIAKAFAKKQIEQRTGLDLG